MSKPYVLSQDMLAKGLTEETLILGVPTNIALLNGLVFFVLGLGLSIFSGSIIALIVMIGLMACSHLIMKFVSLKDKKAVEIACRGCITPDSKVNGGTNQYSPQAHAIDKTLRENSASRYLPYECMLDEYTIVNTDGVLLQFIALEGVAFRTQEDIDIDCDKSLAARVLAQISDPNIGVYSSFIKLKSHVYPEGRYKIDYASGLNRRYQEHLAKKQSYDHRYVLCIAHKAMLGQGEGFIQSVLGFFTPKSEKENSNKEAAEKLDSIAIKLCEQFKYARASRLSIVETNDEQYAEHLSFISYLVNLDDRKRQVPIGKIGDYLSFKKHIFAKRRGLIQIKDSAERSKYCAMLSLKEYPKYTYAGMFDVLLGVPYELVLTQSFEFQSKSNAEKKLKQQSNLMQQSDESIQLIDDVELAIDDLKAGEITYGNHHVSLCVIADSVDDLNKAVACVDSRLNEQSGLIFVREEKGCEKAFWAQMPGNFKHRIRRSLINNFNFAALSSFHNHPKGQLTGNRWGSAITMLETIAGTLYALNVHHGQVAIAGYIGPMGGGKTHGLAVTLTLSTKYSGWRFIFDKDRGMEIIIRALGGSYAVLGAGRPTGMAPLQLEDNVENRNFNVSLLKNILSIKSPLSEADEKHIVQAVNGVYALDKAERTYSNLAPFFGTSTPGSLREKFDSWCVGGDKGWVFDNPSDNFEIDNKIYGLDIEAILKKENAEVCTPILMYVFNRIGELMDGSPTMAFIPEGWQVLEEPSFQKQLEDWSRTSRKNNLALIIDTQDIKKLSASEAGCGIIRESSLSVFFANEKAEYKHYKKFGLNDKEIRIIQEELPALSSQHYFLLKQGQQSVIARFPMAGMDDDLNILSGNKTSVAVLDKVREKVGDAPDDFLQPFLNVYRYIKKQYPDESNKWEKEFNEIWEKYHA